MHAAFVFLLRECEDRDLLSTSYLNYLWIACKHLEKKVLEEQGLMSNWKSKRRAQEQAAKHAAYAIRQEALSDPETVAAAIAAFAALTASQGLTESVGPTQGFNDIEGNENDTE